MMPEKIDEILILTETRFIKQKEYWQNKLSGDIVETQILLHTRESSKPRVCGRRKPMLIPGRINQQLMKLSKKSDLSIYLILLAALESLIYRYTGNEDIIVISPVFTPAGPGQTLNDRVFIRNRVHEQMTFKDLLLQIRQSVIEAYDNQDYPYKKLIQHLDPPSIRRSQSLSAVLCLLTGIHNTEPAAQIKNKMVFYFTRDQDQVNGFIYYDGDIYEMYFIEQIHGDFINILEAAIFDVNKKLFEITCLTNQEKKRLIIQLNDTASAYPGDKTLQQLFEKQVEKTPDNIALVYEHQELSYREVNNRANQLAGLLKRKGVNPDSIVGILADRSIEMIIGIAAVLKANGAYLPIDPGYPAPRIKYMLEDTCAKIVLLQTHLPGKVKFPADIIDINNKEIFIGDSGNLDTVNNGKDVAYIIYTSGSTGNPKGVIIQHASVINLAYARKERFKVNEKDRILQFSSICFDASVEQIFMAFFSGSVLVLIHRDVLLDMDRFERFIQAYSITHLHAVPAFLNNIEMNESYKLKRMVSGGDVCPLPLVQKWYKKCEFYNEYGPTETTVTSIDMLISAPDETLPRVPIGKPLNNTTAYILDKWQKLIPFGAAGELYIGGVGTARGYLNNPELTKDKFLAAPFVKNQRLYRTGDLARYLPGGNIDFLGRIDQQVKIRGIRLELGEIQNRLLKYQDIKNAVVTTREDETGEKYTCAYVVSNCAFNETRLREYLSGWLPDYMIPTWFIRLDKLPLTLNGKIDRNALPEPAAGITTGKYAPPRTPLEKKLAAIWSEVLETANERISIDDNFFQLGGHSLKATILMAKIYKTLKVKVPLVEVFRTPSIRELAEFIHRGGETSSLDIHRLETREYYPLSYHQQRIFILQQLDPGSPAFNMCGYIEMNHEADEALVKKVLAQITRRHESLRTCIKTAAGKHYQVVCAGVTPPLEIMDLTQTHPGAAGRESEEVYTRIAAAPFDLAQAPLFRAVLVKLTPGTSRLIFNLHHITADGWSLEILKKEFTHLYEANRQGKDPALPSLPIQYRDFSQWHNQQLRGAAGKESHRYWQEKLAPGVPLLQLPADREQAREDNSGALFGCMLPTHSKERLKKLAEINHTTLFTVMFSLYILILHRVSGQEEISCALITDGREHPSLHDVIGFFVNSIIFITRVDRQQAFKELVKRINEDVVETLPHQSYPLEFIFEESGTRYPRIPAAFNMVNLEETEVFDQLPPYTPRHIQQTQDVKFDIEVYMTVYANGIDMQWVYKKNMFNPAAIEYMIHQYMKQAEFFSSSPGRSLDHLLAEGKNRPGRFKKKNVNREI